MSGRTPERWRDQALAGFTVQTERFLELLVSLDDEQGAGTVPGLEWTAAQTAAHVCSLYRRLTEDPRRAADAAGVAVQNAADVEAIGEDVVAIAAEMRQRLEAVQSFVPHIDPESTFPFHAGQRVTMAAGLGVMIGELIAHGDDIARATGTSWVAGDDGLEVLWRLTVPVLTGWTTHGAASVDRRWSFDFGWAEGPVVLHVDQGTVTMESTRVPSGTHVDHHVAVGDAVEFTLMFPYRRRRLDDPAVAELAELFQPV